jgi:hypothetical protein
MWKLRVFVENSEKLIMYPKGVKEAVIGFFENIWKNKSLNNNLE